MHAQRRPPHRRRHRRRNRRHERSPVMRPARVRRAKRVRAARHALQAHCDCATPAVLARQRRGERQRDVALHAAHGRSHSKAAVHSRCIAVKPPSAFRAALQPPPPPSAARAFRRSHARTHRPSHNAPLARRQSPPPLRVFSVVLCLLHPSHAPRPAPSALGRLCRPQVMCQSFHSRSALRLVSRPRPPLRRPSPLPHVGPRLHLSPQPRRLPPRARDIFPRPRTFPRPHATPASSGRQSAPLQIASNSPFTSATQQHLFINCVKPANPPALIPFVLRLAQCPQLAQSPFHQFQVLRPHTLP